MKNKIARPRGRPRTFDREEVLNRAMMTFWAKGYNGASLDDLTGEMGINRPSLYAAFGDKHRLFLEAVDHYAATIARAPVEIFQRQPDLRKAVHAFFEAVIDNTSSAGHPLGCLIGCVVADEAGSDPAVGEKLASLLAETDEALAARFRQAQKDGALSRNTDAKALAKLTASVMYGIAVRARGGATPAQLKRLAREAENLLLGASTKSAVPVST